MKSYSSVLLEHSPYESRAAASEWRNKEELRERDRDKQRRTRPGVNFDAMSGLGDNSSVGNSMPSFDDFFDDCFGFDTAVSGEVKVGNAHTVKAALSPVDIAKAQYVSGSFRLEDDWALLLVAEKRKTEDLTLEDLKNAIPSSIASIQDAGIVWATVVALTLLREKMMDRKDEWVGLWVKGKKFVLDNIGGDEALFTKLVDEAVKFV